MKSRKVQIENHNQVEPSPSYNPQQHHKWLEEFQRVTPQSTQRMTGSGAESLPTPRTTPLGLRNRVTLTARAMDEIARLQVPQCSKDG